jgi:hypothetical protein
LEKLRGVLAKRAITTTAALASVISANAVQVAPPALAVTLTSTSLAAAGAGTSFLKMMTTTNLKWGLGALIVGGAITVFVFQRLAQQSMRVENQSLAVELAQLKVSATPSDRISATSDSLSKEQRAELSRLRAEATRLRAVRDQLAAAVALIATNEVPEEKKLSIDIKIRFVTVPAEQMPGISLGWISTGDRASLLSKEQFEGILKKIKDRSIDLLNEGQVTTLDGREANISVTSPDSADNATNTAVGSTIDVIPHFSVDSSIFTLNIIAQLFQSTTDPAHPIQLLQTTNQVNLISGQTAALEQDLTPGRWLLETPAVSDGPTKLLVFITPTAIDDKGQLLEVSPGTNLKLDTDTADLKWDELKQGF